MCCTKISDLDYFSKSRNGNLHLLVHKVFLMFRCKYENISCSTGARYLARLTKYHAGIILIIEMFE